MELQHDPLLAHVPSIPSVASWLRASHAAVELARSYLGGIGEVLALLDLEIHVCLFPVVRDGEDGLGAGKGFDERLLVAHIGL